MKPEEILYCNKYLERFRVYRNEGRSRENADELADSEAKKALDVIKRQHLPLTVCKL